MPANIPETAAVVCHPFAFMDQTTIGTAKPPAANPRLPVARARARRRSNHRTIATVTVRNPLKPAPIAINKKDPNEDKKTNQSEKISDQSETKFEHFLQNF